MNYRLFILIAIALFFVGASTLACVLAGNPQTAEHIVDSVGLVACLLWLYKWRV